MVGTLADAFMRRQLDSRTNGRNVDGHGTYVHEPSQSSQSAEHCLYDFMAFRDQKSIPHKKPQIITSLAATEVWNEKTRRPCVSDHLPVEGFLAL